MLHRFLFRFSIIVAAIGLIAVSIGSSAQDTTKRGRKYKAPPPTGHIEVTVLRDVNDKPIENAAVVFHPMEGNKDMGAMELKTNEEGKTIIDVLPIGGTVRLQIIAKGFQTYGQDYKVDKAEMAIEIKMKRPGEQYSIYKDHSKDGADKAAPSENATPSKAVAPTDKEKPADSSPPADSPSTQPQPK